MTTLTLHREHRAPLTAVKHDDGVIVRMGTSFLQLTSADLAQLYAFATGGARLMRYPVTAPESTLTGGDGSAPTCLKRDLRYACLSGI